MINNILILAAGEGVRLLPLTSDIPKPLLEIDEGNTTILDRLFQQCRRYLPGISIKINVGFCAEKILIHFKDTPYMDRPIFLYEKDILGPAQTLVQLSSINEGKTLVIHGDLVLSDEGFSKFVDFAETAESQLIVCHERPRSMARSEVIYSGNIKKMERIIEFPLKGNDSQTGSNNNVLVSSGIFIIDLSKVSSFRAEPNQSLSPDLLNFINDEKMDIYLWDDWRYAIDSVATLQEARLKLSSKI